MSAFAPPVIVKTDNVARYFLRRWMGKTALLQQNLTTTRATLAFIGDSWVYNDFITNPLKRTLQTRYGNAGPGYCTLAPIGGNAPETAVATLGTWAVTGAPSLTAGVDLNYVLSSDVATPAKKTLTAQGTDFVVHYFVQPGGGSFTWQIDGGAATTINTAGGALAFASVTIAGQTNASHALALTVTVAGTAGVILCGVDVQIAVPGVRLHRIGATGQQVSGYLNATSQTIWAAGIAALNPDTVFIVFGTNEMNANTPPATYLANLAILIGWVRTAVPLADIVLMTPTDNGITGTTYTMLDYSAAMATAAAANGTGFLNAYLDMGPYANANTLGLYQNLGHLNQYGGQLVANLALNYLQNGVFPNTVANSGTRNFFLSLNAGDPTFAGGGARGAGGSLTTGTDNAGIGQALANLTSGSSNTAMGSNAANTLTTGSVTAFGANALQLAVTAIDSSAFGVAALQKATGNGNSAFGSSAGLNVSTGAANTFFGAFSGASMTIGASATLIGYNAGVSNVSGANMAALGRNAALSATGDNITALGNGAALGVTTGDANTMVGQNAGSAVTTGRANTILGRTSGILATLANNIILADGDGNIGLQVDNARVARTNSATFILGSKTTITGGATTFAPTLTAGPKAGNPTKWLPYDDNGVTRYIPAW